MAKKKDYDVPLWGETLPGVRIKVFPAFRTHFDNQNKKEITSPCNSLGVYFDWAVLWAEGITLPIQWKLEHWFSIVQLIRVLVKYAAPSPSSVHIHMRVPLTYAYSMAQVSEELSLFLGIPKYGNSLDPSSLREPASMAIASLTGTYRLYFDQEVIGNGHIERAKDGELYWVFRSNSVKIPESLPVEQKSEEVAYSYAEYLPLPDDTWEI